MKLPVSMETVPLPFERGTTKYLLLVAKDWKKIGTTMLRNSAMTKFISV